MSCHARPHQSGKRKNPEIKSPAAFLVRDFVCEIICKVEEKIIKNLNLVLKFYEVKIYLIKIIFIFLLN
jgi:hypothetical protein